jgi:hypothetical protein
MRWALLPAALLVVGSVAAACGGGAPATSAPSSAPSAAPSVQPSGTPSVEPSASPLPSASTPTEATLFEVPLTIATDHTVRARVADWTGLVTGATSGTPGDGASVPLDEAHVANDGPRTLVVTWAAGPCDATPTVVLDADRSLITVIQEPCEGDAIAFDRIVRLDLREALDAASMRGVLQPGGDTPGS